MKGRGPLQVALSDLQRRAGTQREIRASAQLDGLELTGLEVTADDVVDVDLVVESLHDGVVVTGTVRGVWHGTCRRCLDPVQGDLEVQLREVYSASLAALGAVEDADVQALPAEVLDLRDPVREAVLLALPLAPLCSPDCAGPDPERFPAEVAPDTGELDSDAEAPRDPRWAALDELRLDDSN